MKAGSTRHLLPMILLMLGFSTAGITQPDIAYQPVIGPTAGLDLPIEVASAPGDASGRLFIVEQAGRIRIWNGTTVLSTSFLDITADVLFNFDERGLLSMAFHPDYQSNGYFYVYFNNNAGNITVRRYQVSSNPNVADTNPLNIDELVSIPKPFANHNGGHLQFRVEGGVNYLYFATGDGGSGNDPNNYAQNYTSLLGKMIRMNVDAATPVAEIWAWGLRNPFRWSFDRATGDMWIGDVGQSTREEINFRAGGTYGANYGWACQEGAQANPGVPGSTRCDTVRAVDVVPVYDYDNPTLGASVIGGYVYRKTEFPTLQGYYLATDYYSGNLWLILPNGSGGWEITTKPGYQERVSSISETADGTLYAVWLEGNAVYKIVVPVVTPLTLVRFFGKTINGSHELVWMTEFEDNLANYTIEYSADGRIFNAVGQKAPFNTTGTHQYSFIHPFTGNRNYYRLRINELDGRHSYSPVISLSAGQNTGISVYPTTLNAGSGMLNIIAGSPVEKLSLVSGDGRQVFTKDMNGAEGYFTVPLQNLQKGIYLLVFVSGGQQESRKILVH